MAFIRVRDFYFLTVLLLILLSKLIGWFWLKSQLVSFLGWLAYRFSRDKRCKSEEGLEKAFGSELDEQEKQRVLLSGFRSFWSDSFAVLPLKRELAELEQAVIDGEEYLRSALRRGKGAILLESNSFGNRLVAKQILFRRGFPVHQVHSENHLNGLRNDGLKSSWVRKSILNATFESWEKEFAASMIYISGDGSLLFTRTLLNCLTANSIVCSAADGRMGQKLIRMPFLGRMRPFATGMFSLSALSGAAILPLFCFRNKKEEVRLIIGPDRVIAKGKVKEALASYLKQLEGHVRSCPEQYRNWQF